METFFYLLVALLMLLVVMSFVSWIIVFFDKKSNPEKYEEVEEIKEEEESWICQNCQTKLVRKEIKFGLCPKCGVKVKDFRGLSAFDKPFFLNSLP